jgi:hypothetical protein
LGSLSENEIEDAEGLAKKLMMKAFANLVLKAQLQVGTFGIDRVPTTAIGCPGSSGSRDSRAPQR